jgi:hypothetical protein
VRSERCHVSGIGLRGDHRGRGGKDMIVPTGHGWLGDQARVLVCWGCLL